MFNQILKAMIVLRNWYHWIVLFLRLLCVNVIFLALASRYPFRRIPMGLFISHLPTLGAASLMLPASLKSASTSGYRSIHRTRQICVHLCSITHTSQIVRMATQAYSCDGSCPLFVSAAAASTMFLVALQSLLVSSS